MYFRLREQDPERFFNTAAKPSRPCWAPVWPCVTSTTSADVPSFLFSGSTSSNTVGFVAGGGLRFKLGRVDITPEVRYTRWGGGNFSQSLVNLLPLNRNEASILVGVTF